jgi:hypothetical protein
VIILIKFICGIDPGLAGGLCILQKGDTHNVVDVRIMPITSTSDKDINMGVIKNYLSYYKPHLTIIERQIVVRPRMVEGKEQRQGLGSAAKTMFNYGRLIGLLEGIGLNYVVVDSREWQSHYADMAPPIKWTYNKPTKTRSVSIAVDLYPTVNLFRTSLCHKPHDGMAEAVLLAHYGAEVNDDL